MCWQGLADLADPIFMQVVFYCYAALSSASANLLVMELPLAFLVLDFVLFRLCGLFEQPLPNPWHSPLTVALTKTRQSIHPVSVCLENLGNHDYLTGSRRA